jgi:hypothetical protein
VITGSAGPLKKVEAVTTYDAFPRMACSFPVVLAMFLVVLVTLTVRSRLLVADICNETVGLARQRLRYLAAIGEDTLHRVF